jgi:hypothetical protein
VYKQGWKSIHKKYKACNNEIEDLMLKGILCNKSTNDGGALVGMCGKDEEL